VTYIEEEDYIKIMQTIPVVCVDALIQNKKQEFLLVKRDNEPLKGKFWMPGGRLHKGETSEQGVIRKIKQELGVNCRVIKCLGHFEEFFDKVAQVDDCSFHAVSIVFLIELESEDIELDSQSSEWKWFKDLPPILRNYSFFN
jgi:colanic acid biosynthesis protein WcaH